MHHQNLHISQHPIAKHYLTQLRDKTTDAETFRRLTNHLSVILALEAAKHLPVKDKPIETPVEATTGFELAQKLTVVAILRAGISMVEPIVNLFPHTSVGYIGLERDEKTAKASQYYLKLPPINDQQVWIIDPMLATGGTTLQAIEKLQIAGAQHLACLHFVAAPEGINAIHQHHPNMPIYTLALDRQLNEKSYIQPGLGDFGDRLYDTVH